MSEQETTKVELTEWQIMALIRLDGGHLAEFRTWSAWVKSDLDALIARLLEYRCALENFKPRKY